MATGEPGKDKEDGAELGSAARQMQAANPYISAVWKLIGGGVVGVLGGYLLDKQFGTAPWILVGLSVAGISVGFYAFIKEMLRLGKK